MFEKAAHNADHADVFAQAGDFRAQATDAADDQVNGHICTGSFLKFLDNLFIDEMIEFGDDAGRFACQCVIALALDQSDKAAVQIERRHHQLLQAGITGQTGESVKNHCHFLGQLRVAREQTEVGINARCARVIIAGAELGIPAGLVRVTAND
jgi:hypothetical protein